MLWEMRYEKMSYSIEASIRKGRSLPEWYLDEPEIIPADAFYLKAFYDLSTCRQAGMGLGPIPWRDIKEYALFYKLDDDIIEAFVDIIMDMDRAYLEMKSEELENSKPKKPKRK